MYQNPNRLAFELLEGLKPPLRMGVTEVAREHVFIAGDGATTIRYSPDLTPYMRQPQSDVTNRAVEAVIFIGPARSGKTAGLTETVLAHQMYTGGGDVLISEPTEDRARRFGKIRFPRMVKASPELKAKISMRADDDSIHEKILRNGQLIRFGWHAASQLSGDAFQKVVFPDYDRRDDDVEGEGSKFLMGLKRTTTSKSSGKCIAETSPGFEVNLIEWEARINAGLVTKHEIAPTEGLCKYYNQGDRKKLYWQCPHCKEWTRPDMEFLKLFEGEPHLVCEACGSFIHESQKQQLNLHSKWIADDGPVMNKRWSTYWMEGPAATYQSWSSLIQKTDAAIASYESLKTFDRTRAMNDWKLVVNTDHGRPFIPPKPEDVRDQGEVESRAEAYERGAVPAGVEFIVATVDQQINRFVVQIVGFGKNRECWLIDRYNMAESHRSGQDGRRLRMSPFTHAEDWEDLIKVFTRSYDGLTPVKVWIDTGGKDNATSNAYAFSRLLASKTETKGLLAKLMLGKGERRASGEITKVSEKVPQGSLLPLNLCDVTRLGNELEQMLNRSEQGASYIHFPQWLVNSNKPFFAELTSMRWDGKGGYERKNDKAANEAWILFVYALAIYYSLGAPSIKWDNPPMWARRHAQQEIGKSSGMDWLTKAAQRMKR
jgi:phage terminase large subunit GpA-like protein